MRARQAGWVSPPCAAASWGCSADLHLRDGRVYRDAQIGSDGNVVGPELGQFTGSSPLPDDVHGGEIVAISRRRGCVGLPVLGAATLRRTERPSGCAAVARDWQPLRLSASWLARIYEVAGAPRPVRDRGGRVVTGDYSGRVDVRLRTGQVVRDVAFFHDGTLDEPDGPGLLPPGTSVEEIDAVGRRRLRLGRLRPLGTRWGRLR